jgi:ABC-2 type transport system permease protein
MNQGIKKAQAFLSVYYAYMLEYRAELFLWALSGTLPLDSDGRLDKASQKGQFGLKPEDFVRYFLMVFLVRQFTVVWVVWEFEKEVVEGKLSPRLLQPIDPVWHHVASHLSERLARLPFALLLVGLFFFLYPQADLDTEFEEYFAVWASVRAGFCLRFLMQYTFALFAFWTERASAIEQFWFLFYLVSLWDDCSPRSLSPSRAPGSAVDALPLSNSLPRRYFDWATCRYCAGCIDDAGLESAVFHLEPLAMAQGLKQYSGMGA